MPMDSGEPKLTSPRAPKGAHPNYIHFLDHPELFSQAKEKLPKYRPEQERLRGELRNKPDLQAVKAFVQSAELPEELKTNVIEVIDEVFTAWNEDAPQWAIDKIWDSSRFVIVCSFLKHEFPMRPEK